MIGKFLTLITISFSSLLVFVLVQNHRNEIISGEQKTIAFALVVFVPMLGTPVWQVMANIPKEELE
jgi:hypothetical protein